MENNKSGCGCEDTEYKEEPIKDNSNTQAEDNGCGCGEENIEAPKMIVDVVAVQRIQRHQKIVVVVVELLIFRIYHIYKIQISQNS